MLTCSVGGMGSGEEVLQRKKNIAASIIEEHILKEEEEVLLKHKITSALLPRARGRHQLIGGDWVSERNTIEMYWKQCFSLNQEDQPRCNGALLNNKHNYGCDFRRVHQGHGPILLISSNRHLITILKCDLITWAHPFLHPSLLVALQSHQAQSLCITYPQVNGLNT